MANTADTLGEQEALDGLVAHTLEDFEDSRITTLRDRAFDHNDKLKLVNLPNVTSVGSSVFQYCSNLETAIMLMVEYLPMYTFRYCHKLKTLSIPNIKKINSINLFEGCYSLNDLDLTNITTLANDTLYDSGFGTIILPNCTSIGSHLGSGLRISTIDLSKVTSNINSLFNGIYSLVHLILRNDTLRPLSATSAFADTPINNGIGWIYVPNDLVDSYKTASNWSTYADQIVSIDEYPKALSGETITDSWDDIFQAESDGSYKTKYSVGDTKYLVVGGTYVLMQIIAFDRDILSSDHTSTAKITWLAKSLSFQFPMNFKAVTEGGWADCECRKFLSDTIYEQIPENVRNKIVAVDKTYTATGLSSSTATVSDKLWIPSAREIQGGSAFENTGIDYTDFFTGSSVRIKHMGLLTNNASSWWLRSVGSTTQFRYVSSNGGVNTTSSSSTNPFPLGFCT